MDYNALAQELINSISKKNIKDTVILVSIFTAINIIGLIVNYFLQKKINKESSQLIHTRNLKEKEQDIVKELYDRINGLCKKSFVTEENARSLAPIISQNVVDIRQELSIRNLDIDDRILKTITDFLDYFSMIATNPDLKDIKKEKKFKASIKKYYRNI